MTIIYAILMFCVLIFIHELGHFIAAKKCGVKVNQFALGMGPAIWKKQKGETEYSLRVFPIGGYCAMEGEDEDSDDPRAFNKKKPWQKCVIAFAGPFMNALLALILMCIIAFVSGTPTTSVGKLESGSPAIKAGLEKGDRLIKVNGTRIEEWEDISQALKDAKEGQEATIIIERNGEKKSIRIQLMKSEDGRIIIGINPAMEKKIGSSLKSGFKSTCSLTRQMYNMIRQMFTGDVSVRELSGPVGIVYVVNKSVAMGFMYFIYLLAMLSLNLAIVNLLPLPALDGGRIVLTVIRKLTGKVITDQMEAKINLIGILLLLSLMVFVTWNDIFKFVIPAFK